MSGDLDREMADFFHARYIEEATKIRAAVCVGSVFVYLNELFVVLWVCQGDRDRRLFNEPSLAASMRASFRAEYYYSGLFHEKIFYVDHLPAIRVRP